MLYDTMIRSAAVLALGLSITLAVGATTNEARGDGLEITTHTIDAGGGTSTGGTFELCGTIGQADAHTESAAAMFTLAGGFWPGLNGGSPCPADIDGSGDVGFGDLLAVLSAWGSAGGPADIDSNGTVDFGDLLIVLSIWGAC